MKVKEIYAVIDHLAPLSMQDSYDNSGLMTGDAEAEVSRVLLTLDITPQVIAEAETRGCELIMAHHPAIFDPLRAVPPEHPVYQLIERHIAAICVHTPLDLAKDGVNECLYQALKAPLGLSERTQTVGDGYVGVYSLSRPLPSEELAARLKEALGCTVVRYSPADRPIHVLALGCGSCGSLLEDVIPAGCDAFVTGDVKHDRFHMAACYGMALYDCGHFQTETVVLPALCKALSDRLPGVSVMVADANTDPVRYAL